jgi:hypothetical protein
MERMIRCPLCHGTNVRLMMNSFKDTYHCCGCEFIFTSLKEFSFHGLYEEEFVKTDLHPTFVCLGGRYVIRNEYKLKKILSRLENSVR